MKRLKTHRVSRVRFVVIGLLLLVGLTGCHEFGMPDMGHHPMMPGDGFPAHPPVDGGSYEGPVGSFSVVLPVH